MLWSLAGSPSLLTSASYHNPPEPQAQSSPPGHNARILLGLASPDAPWTGAHPASALPPSGGDRGDWPGRTMVGAGEALHTYFFPFHPGHLPSFLVSLLKKSSHPGHARPPAKTAPRRLPPRPQGFATSHAVFPCLRSRARSPYPRATQAATSPVGSLLNWSRRSLGSQGEAPRGCAWCLPRLPASSHQ